MTGGMTRCDPGGGARRAGRAATAALACAVLAAGVAAGSATAARHGRHHPPAGRCSLKVEHAPQGELGNTNEITVQLKKLSGPSSSWRGATIAVEVKVKNPRISICSATLSEAIFISPSTPAESHEFHLTIGPHGGQSSPVTLSDKMWFVVAQVTARRKPARNLKG